jgi:RHS repeat-associated protein
MRSLLANELGLYRGRNHNSTAHPIKYLPFGEVFIEERNNSWNTPYLFNSKELDEETGLYYYGARYYNPRESVWLSTDPLSGYNPVLETEHYIDGQHNGGVYNSFNHNTYGYYYQSPVLLVDPNGKQVKPKYVEYTSKEVKTALDNSTFTTSENKYSFYRINSRGASLIATYEGLTLEMYDVDGAPKGNATIGIGHLIHYGRIDGRASENEFKNGISKQKAFEMFGEGLREHDKYINKYMKDLDVKLNAEQYAAMVDLSFNAGPSKARKIMSIYKDKGLEAASDAIMELNKNSKGLQLRRYFEKELFNSRALEKSEAEKSLKSNK